MTPIYPTWPTELAELYRETGCWEGLTFGQMLRNRANAYGDNIAVVGEEHRLTYEELDRRVDRLAAGLSGLGIKPSDRVVVQLPNITPFFDVIFALFRLGALPIFALPLHRSSEISYFCEFSEAAAYIIPDTYAGFDYRPMASEVKSKASTLRHVIVVGDVGSNDHLALDQLYQEPIPLPDVKSSAVAFMQLSGGSTGLPKLIPRTHDDYMYSLKKSVEVCKLDTSSVYLAALPVAHNFPLSSPGVLGTLYAGGKIVLSLTPSPDETFPLIEREGVTITALVPPLAIVWMEAVGTRNAKLSSLQVLQVGGAKFSAEAASRVRPTLGCTLQQVFGMAEGLVNYTRLDDPEEVIIHTQGKPMSEWDEIRILDDEDEPVQPGGTGHLLTRGPYTIRGYYNAEEHNARSFTADGFYRTGDIVKLTESGYLIVEGRAKDQINRGGDKVAAEEIENHLLAHPDVHDAAVVSMPDDFLGERTCAFIIAKLNQPRAAEIKSFLRERGIASYKIPDRIEFIDSFPTTSVGKVSKKALREMIARKRSSPPIAVR